MNLCDEIEVNCAHCGEPFTVVVDAAGDHEVTLTEDCAVCCRPMQLTLAVADGELVIMAVEPQ